MNIKRQNKREKLLQIYIFKHIYSYTVFKWSKFDTRITGKTINSFYPSSCELTLLNEHLMGMLPHESDIDFLTK